MIFTDVMDWVIKNNGAIALSLSGGKDSQAMTKVVMEYAQQKGWSTENIFCIHAHLGRTEWKTALPKCKDIAHEWGLNLQVVKREQGDLLQRWQERMEKLKGTGKPFWSSAKNRYCTSDLKRGPINKHFRKYNLIVSCEGIRSDESKERAKKPFMQIRKEITSTWYKGMTIEEALSNYRPDKRLAITINPILDYSLDQVWEEYNHTAEELDNRRILYSQGKVSQALKGWKYNIVYVYGNDRFSCSICVLACDSDIRNGAKHNPELKQTLLQMEAESGCSFKSGKSLKQIINS